MSAFDAPPPGTVEAWALAFLTSTDLSIKLDPGPPPGEWLERAEPILILRPGRPPALTPRHVRLKSPRPGALVDPRKRAVLIHTFLHHELQAAELFAWCLLRFPAAPGPFRRGVLGVLGDELRHARMYAELLERLGHPYGSLPVNDWFWERVPQAESPRHFVASLGMGLEGGNLDHGRRFAALFRAAGDERAARVQEHIVEEEIPHVAFALHWFARLGPGVTTRTDFGEWREHLPAPLSPRLMRGRELNLEARRRAGYPEPFLELLAAWT